MRVTNFTRISRLLRMTAEAQRLDRTTSAFPTTLNDIAGKAIIEVFSTTEPNLAGLIGGGRASTYTAVKRGDYPVIRSGRRIRVAVPALLKMLNGEG